MTNIQIQEYIANRINRLLKNKKMSLRQLSQISGISLAHISKILNSKVNPTIIMLQHLSCALDVHISYFFEKLPGVTKVTDSTRPVSETLTVCILSIGDKRIVHISSSTNKDYGYLELPSNIKLSETVNTSIDKIKYSIDTILNNNNIHDLEYHNCNVIISVQCFEFSNSKNKLIDACKRIFNSIEIYPDWQITHVSSFKYKSGISIVADKGLSISYFYQNKLYKIGGWGFPHDIGGEYWIGLQAAQYALRVLDGFESHTTLSNSIITKFNNNAERLIEYCSINNLGAYLELSTTVLNHVALHDNHAISIISKGYSYIEDIISYIDNITKDSSSPITLHGSIANIYTSYIPKSRHFSSPSNQTQCQMLSKLSEDIQEVV